MISDDRNKMSSKTQNLEQIIIQVIFKCPQSANNIKAKPLSPQQKPHCVVGRLRRKKRERAGYFNKESQREPLRRRDTKPQTKLKIVMKMKRRFSE